MLYMSESYPESVIRTVWDYFVDGNRMHLELLDDNHKSRLPSLCPSFSNLDFPITSTPSPPFTLSFPNNPLNHCLQPLSLFQFFCLGPRVSSYTFRKAPQP